MHQNCLNKMHQTWPDAPNLPGQDAPEFLGRCIRMLWLDAENKAVSVRDSEHNLGHLGSMDQALG
ncbi:hypothetical protein TanjilG_26507 [Lupinus angustifolius]|uniref:Uncharacterized protein n=1 Tax=Lupinus angustifolius TaxID=3871 RepID=A0A4P1QPH8_LUPAN|nr:hypothetical protein TanjilG_26507 [Lupinus angustifolius]